MKKKKKNTHSPRHYFPFSATHQPCECDSTKKSCILHILHLSYFPTFFFFFLVYCRANPLLMTPHVYISICYMWPCVCLEGGGGVVKGVLNYVSLFVKLEVVW